MNIAFPLSLLIAYFPGTYSVIVMEPLVVPLP